MPLFESPFHVHAGSSHRASCIQAAVARSIDPDAAALVARGCPSNCTWKNFNEPTVWLELLRLSRVPVTLACALHNDRRYSGNVDLVGRGLLREVGTTSPGEGPASVHGSLRHQDHAGFRHQTRYGRRCAGSQGTGCDGAPNLACSVVLRVTSNGRRGRPTGSGNRRGSHNPGIFNHFQTTPRRIRTSNLRFRRPMLYPIELAVLQTEQCARHRVERQDATCDGLAEGRGPNRSDGKFQLQRRGFITDAEHAQGGF